MYAIKLILILHCSALSIASKMYSGQRILNDYHMIDFIDPSKHGFHIILDQSFVDTHLQPTKLPTVFASAIPLRRPQWKESKSNQSNIGSGPVVSKTPLASVNVRPGMTRRVTKVLYPENGGPEDGLLDGRTIKLLGLQEKSWYYVCVEFESNLNRHEMATGVRCQLKRTLDKFGKSSESTVSDLSISETTDRSITVQLVVDVDFPLSLTVYMDQSTGELKKSIPAQTFMVDRQRNLNIFFGPYLESDTKYGRLCVLEEPKLESADIYTAMGRAVHISIEHCFFDELRTKASVAIAQSGGSKTDPPNAYQEHYHMAEEAKSTSESINGNRNFLTLISAMVLFSCMYSRNCAISVR